MRYYLADRDYPAHLEPSGADFLSPALTEAHLMRRLLPPDDFTDWLDAFLPGLEKGAPATLLQPAHVSDRSDPQIGHLDGLNLSRAWCMYGIASALPATFPARPVLLRSADRHEQDGLTHVCSGHYSGEHWLATFAVLLLTSE